MNKNGISDSRIVQAIVVLNNTGGNLNEIERRKMLACTDSDELLDWAKNFFKNHPYLFDHFSDNCS